MCGFFEPPPLPPPPCCKDQFLSLVECLHLGVVLGLLGTGHLLRQRVLPGEDLHLHQNAGDENAKADGDHAIPPVGPVTVAPNQRRNGKGYHRHKLDQDVQRRARGIFERITHSVAHNACLALFRLLDAELLAELLAVIPGTAGVGHGDGHHAPGGDGAGEHAHEAARAHQEAHRQRGQHRVRPGRQHLPHRGPRRDLHTPVGVGLHVLVGGDLEALAGLDDAVLEAGHLAELAPHLLDDLRRRLAHRHHGQRRKHEGQHRTKEHARKDQRVRHVQLLVRQTGLLLEGGKEREGGEHGGPDGEPLPGGGGGVAQGVQGVRLAPHLLGDAGVHLRQPPGVVRHRPVGVSGQGDAEGGQHAHGGDGHPVLVLDGVAGDDGDAEDQRGGHARDHAHAQALDDNGGGAGHAAVLDGDHGGEVERGEVFRELADQHAGDETDQDTVELVPHVVQDGAHAGGASDEDSAGKVHPLLQRKHERAEVGAPARALLLGGHHEEAQHGRHNAHSRQPERQRHLGVALGQAGGSDDGPDVRLKQVRAHARHVAHVVAHVVRNHRRVVRVVLVDARLQLAYQVGAHVRRLGVDAARHARKQRHRRRSEAKARQNLHGRIVVVVMEGVVVDVELSRVVHDTENFLVRVVIVAHTNKNVHAGYTEETKAHHGESHDRAGGESHLETVIQGASSARNRGTHVAVSGNHHAEEAGQPRQYSAAIKSGHDAHTIGLLLLPGDGEEQAQRSTQNEYEYREVLVLLLEKRNSTGLDFCRKVVELGVVDIRANLGLVEAEPQEEDEKKA
mmetsp:Transcript_33142/g.55543  ORF Transcript_33142/g.55543 Transcript_33142/m.55543 type:complete len:789 (-) Transcript_33142:223-2589(-)